MPQADILCGYGGKDRLLGFEGNDYLDGGKGDDIVTGGSGPGPDVREWRSRSAVRQGRRLATTLSTAEKGTDIARTDAGDQKISIGGK